MLPLTKSRAQQSRAHLLALKALDAPTEFPSDSFSAASAALAECLAFHSNGAGSFSLAEAFALAERVMQCRDEHFFGVPVVFDLQSLIDIVGNRELACLAVRLCGGYRDFEKDCWLDGDKPGGTLTFSEGFEISHCFGVKRQFGEVR